MALAERMSSDRRLSGCKGGGDLRDLERLEISKIPIQSIKDMYHVLTNRKSLEIIFEQYINNVEKIEKEGKGSDAVFEPEGLREMKKPIIDYIMGLKNKIKIDELLDFDGKNLEEERQDKKRQEEIEKWIAKNEPECNMDAIRSAKCTQCGKFSNICCTNCDVWVCVDHWRNHGHDSHNMD